MKTWLLLPVAASLLAGCSSISDALPNVRGMVYTHIRVPVTSDLHNTPVPESTGRGRIVLIKEPISGYGMSAEFSSNAIGDIAPTNGIDRVDFADMEILSILGIWRESRLHLYGQAELVTPQLDAAFPDLGRQEAGGENDELGADEDEQPEGGR